MRRRQRHVEIAGAGFAGLTAACALAQRGWSVRVHERSDSVRTAGSGIYIYENGLRVLEAVGAYEEAAAGASVAHTREVRDEQNRTVAVHHWKRSRVLSLVRQNVINALLSSAQRSGAEIITGSEALGAIREGRLILATGEQARADLVIAADGVNSHVRDSLGFTMKRRPLVDGAIRLLIDRTEDDRNLAQEGRTIEYWSGTRRFLYTPCSRTDLYIGLTMLHSDELAKAIPLNKAEWKGSFPHLESLIDRIDDRGRYDRFEMIRLKRWATGRVAVIGDAAHALPPNLGQGAGCAMMNALSLAVYMNQYEDESLALDAWEKNERPLTDHTQRISYLYGLPTRWPPKLRAAAFAIASRSKWLVAQRARTAIHRPTGT